MLRVLVLGMTETIGGMETYIRNLTLHSDKEKIVYDYLIKGQNRGCYEDEINSFYTGGARFWRVKKIKENPLRTYMQLREIYKNTQYDAVYINTCTASDILYACMVLKNTPIIMHSHFSAGQIMLSNTLFKGLVKKKTSVKLACSSKAAEWIYGKKERVKIINNGIDIEKYRFSLWNRERIREKYRIRRDEFVIGHVGRLAYPKNQLFLLEVLHELRKHVAMEDVRDIRLILCGDGPDRGVVEKRIKEMDLINHVILVGEVKNTEEYYSSFDVFVMPSLHEGLPMAGIEAQCNGLFCFFSDRIDDRILVTDRAKMIRLTNKKDCPDEWARSIFDTVMRGKNAKEGREGYAAVMAERGYDMRKTSVDIQNLFEDAVRR